MPSFVLVIALAFGVSAQQGDTARALLAGCLAVAAAMVPDRAPNSYAEALDVDSP